MNGYFLTLIILYMLGLGITMSEHGKDREGKHNFWVNLVSTILSLGLIYMAIKTGI